MTTIAATEATLHVGVEDGVATITIDRPPVNVLTIALLQRLENVVSDLQTDDELRLIVLRGEGRVFSAGVDVSEHLGQWLVPMLDAFDRAARTLLASDIPTLAVVHGAALGGACELVALCDLVIAADDAKLGTPEITLGVVPPVGAAVFPSLVGLQRANALVLTGDLISGSEAETWGLVWRAVPADRLQEETAAVIEQFRGRSAASLRLAKRTLRLSGRRDLGAAISAADAEQRRGLPELADADEGLRAFLDKRAPRWSHR